MLRQLISLFWSLRYALQNPNHEEETQELENEVKTQMQVAQMQMAQMQVAQMQVAQMQAVQGMQM